MEYLPTRLFVINTRPDMPDRLRVHVCLYFHMRIVESLTVSTAYNFERGGATKLIIGSSWNNSEKNCIDLCQVQKRSNVILLVVFLEYNIFKCPSHPAWSVFQYCFVDTHTRTHTHWHDSITLPLLHMRTRGNYTVMVMISSRNHIPGRMMPQVLLSSCGYTSVAHTSLLYIQLTLFLGCYSLWHTLINAHNHMCVSPHVANDNCNARQKEDDSNPNFTTKAKFQLVPTASSLHVTPTYCLQVACTKKATMYIPLLSLQGVFTPINTTIRAGTGIATT